MSRTVKRKKAMWQEKAAIVFTVVFSIYSWLLLVTYPSTLVSSDEAQSKRLLVPALVLVLLLLAFFVHMVIHEIGHLVFGLLCGYKFCSFRILCFMWTKQNGKIRLNRLSVSGTGGQCLMVPPETGNNTTGAVLYNMGGASLNACVSAICLLIIRLIPDMQFLAMLPVTFAISGSFLAMINGLPMRMRLVDNDGYNALVIIKSDDALRSFITQLRVNGLISEGVRLKDMPEEWFDFTDDEGMENSLVCTIGVFACNRLMDMNDFKRAKAKMTHMLNTECGMIGLHRGLMLCDLMFCEIVAGNKSGAACLLTTNQKKFMKSMKAYPSVIRTEYAYALMCENDTSKAQHFRAEFDACAKNYPYPCEIETERELIGLVDAYKESIR